jgi:hypothetical protein
MNDSMALVATTTLGSTGRRTLVKEDSPILLWKSAVYVRHLESKHLPREGILKSDDSCISNPEIRNLKSDLLSPAKEVQFEISDFRI